MRTNGGYFGAQTETGPDRCAKITDMNIAEDLVLAFHLSTPFLESSSLGFLGKRHDIEIFG